MFFTIWGENGEPIVNLPSVLCLEVFAICVVLYVLRNRAGKLVTSIRSVLLPVCIGQGAILLLTLAFQVSESPALIRLDNWLNNFYARNHRWLEIPPLVFAGIMMALIMLDFLLRGSRLVSRFLKLEAYLHIVTASLAAFAGFTFAAQHPYSLGIDRDAKVVPREKSPKEQLETKQLNSVAAEALKKAFQMMPPDNLKAYADLVKRVDEDRWTQHESEFRRSIASFLTDDVPPPEPVDRQVSTQAGATSDGAPSTRRGSVFTRL